MSNPPLLKNNNYLTFSWWGIVSFYLSEGYSYEIERNSSTSVRTS